MNIIQAEAPASISTTRRNSCGTVPGRLLERSSRQQKYAVQLAAGENEVRAAQTLRFIVFNLELSEGLEESYVTCRDADLFDAVCDHLIVEDLHTGEIVGTYRMQTGAMAAANHGYYSEQEFDFAPFESRRAKILELGRACVDSRHRNLAVLGLLWEGIVQYARKREMSWLIGCSSMPGVDVARGAALHRLFAASHMAAPEWRTLPRPGWVCPLDDTTVTSIRPPKLLGAYVSLGAKICGPPALDTTFKTVDFLTMIDLDHLPAGFAGHCFN